MLEKAIAKLADAVGQCVHPLTGSTSDYDPLIDLIGEARFVLIGEATHGTHEFYEQRAEITKRLIQEKRFTAVAVEADWPDAFRVNRFVQGLSQDATSNQALGNFHRFPTWMWRNTDVLNFVNWLRQYNDDLPAGRTKTGFYGLDLYSLYSSIAAVLKYLDQVDPEAAQQARSRYACFEHFESDSQSYGYATSSGIAASCEEEAVNQLLALQRQASQYSEQDGPLAADEFFYAEQNARLVKNAEEYYRSMFRGRVSSWNLRDRHMAETLDALSTHLEQQSLEQQPQSAKIVVWAHNSHLGDARATDMGAAGEWNVGQLVRERYGQAVVSIGFSTYTGTVTAANDWDSPAELKQVRPALPESYEALFHETGYPCFLLNLRQDNSAIAQLQKTRLERAIGVIYRPHSERLSHYFYSQLPSQFNAIIHIDDTRAVEPLDRDEPVEDSEVPDTYPSEL